MAGRTRRVLLGLAAGAGVLAATACGSDERAQPQAPVDAEAPIAAASAWEPVAPSPLSARAHHVGVWVGTELLVVGGDTFLCPPGADCEPPDGPALRDGAMFDPSSGAWRSIADAPIGFAYARTAVVGTDAYFWVWPHPGTDLAAPALLRYSVPDDAWTSLPTVAETSSADTIVAAGDRVIAMSASDERGVVPDMAFDPATEAWSPLLDDPLGPSYDRAMVASGPHVYLFARALVPNPGSAAPSLTRAARMDVRTGAWEQLPDSELLSSGPWVVEGSRLVNPTLGGADGGEVNNWGRTYPYGGVFDTETLTWGPLPTPPNGPRRAAGAFGTADAHYDATDGVVLDARTMTWIDLPPLSSAGTTVDVAPDAAGVDAFVFGGARWDGTHGALLADAAIWRTGRSTQAAPPAEPVTSTGQALVDLGAAVDGAPEAVRTLDDDGVRLCGVEAPDVDRPLAVNVDESARRCFLDAHLANSPAAFVRSYRTTEGDPIVDVWHARADGRVELFSDATRDHFGSGEWDLQMCDRLTTRFPQAREPLPPSYFTCEVGADRVEAPANGGPPPWFVARAALPLCGYDVRIEDADMARRRCFHEAYVAGEPAEFAYVEHGDEGERAARWFRVIGPGRYEVIERGLPSAASHSIASWTRSTCPQLTFLDEPGFDVDDLPTAANESCSVVDRG